MRIYKAIVLNDYPLQHYATWVKEQKKTIETRMNNMNYRGELVICCGGKSVTSNKGKALCIVTVYDCRPMTDDDEKAACIGNVEGRKAILLKDWKYFSRDFTFSKRKVGGSFQYLFDITIPDDVEIVEGVTNEIAIP